jgi:hypothetical protein
VQYNQPWLALSNVKLDRWYTEEVRRGWSAG